MYLATVIDCYSKKVVGWAIEDHMRTELIEQALRNAAESTPIEEGAVFHSDRGSVYTSSDFRKSVKDLGMRSSMGRTGVCWDNAMAESFFAALKMSECIGRRIRARSMLGRISFAISRGSITVGVAIRG